MRKMDASEAAPIINTAMGILMQSISSRGREGSDCRTAVGDLLARVDHYLLSDTIGEPLDEVFELARKAGARLTMLEHLRVTISSTATRSLGATLVKDSLIQFTLVTESRVISDMTFKSRNDVELIQAAVHKAFAPAEEVMADEMDAATYRALISLHAATTRFLSETGRPLPRLINFRFALPLPTVQIAYRLYADADRADELRAENKVVHPAFMRPMGRALSA
jgi:prophage DNA circulation protein